jgi:hypothetical protein
VGTFAIIQAYRGLEPVIAEIFTPPRHFHVLPHSHKHKKDGFCDNDMDSMANDTAADERKIANSQCRILLFGVITTCAVYMWTAAAPSKIPAVFASSTPDADDIATSQSSNVDSFLIILQCTACLACSSLLVARTKCIRNIVQVHHTKSHTNSLRQTSMFINNCRSWTGIASAISISLLMGQISLTALLYISSHVSQPFSVLQDQHAVQQQLHSHLQVPQQLESLMQSTHSLTSQFSCIMAVFTLPRMIGMACVYACFNFLGMVLLLTWSAERWTLMSAFKRTILYNAVACFGILASINSHSEGDSVYAQRLDTVTSTISPSSVPYSSMASAFSFTTFSDTESRILTDVKENTESPYHALIRTLLLLFIGSLPGLHQLLNQSHELMAKSQDMFDQSPDCLAHESEVTEGCCLGSFQR